MIRCGERCCTAIAGESTSLLAQVCQFESAAALDSYIAAVGGETGFLAKTGAAIGATTLFQTRSPSKRSTTYEAVVLLPR